MRESGLCGDYVRVSVCERVRFAGGFAVAICKTRERERELCGSCALQVPQAYIAGVLNIATAMPTICEAHVATRKATRKVAALSRKASMRDAVKLLSFSERHHYPPASRMLWGVVYVLVCVCVCVCVRVCVVCVCMYVFVCVSTFQAVMPVKNTGLIH